MKQASTIIAESIGMDARDIREYRYQRYSGPAVYAIGEKYYAASRVRPRHKVGGEWRASPDQFGARGTELRVWVCDQEVDGAK
jgi:hypothetical protein